MSKRTGADLADLIVGGLHTVYVEKRLENQAHAKDTGIPLEHIAASVVATGIVLGRYAPSVEADNLRDAIHEVLEAVYVDDVEGSLELAKEHDITLQQLAAIALSQSLQDGGFVTL